MNKKGGFTKIEILGIVFAVVLLFAVGYLVLYKELTPTYPKTEFQKEESLNGETQKEEVSSDFEVIHAKLLNQHFPGFGTIEEPFTLTDGAYEYTFCMGKGISDEDCENPRFQAKGGAYLGDTMFLSEKKEDGKYDVATIVSFNSGGTGWFKYLVLLNGAPDTELSYVANYGLGDRVKVHAISFPGGKMILDMTVHGPNDGLCCPSVRTTKTFTLQGTELIEVSE
jgi:hypothetical protein